MSARDERLIPAFGHASPRRREEERLGPLRGFAANEFAERGAATYKKLLCRLVAEHNSRGRLSYIAVCREVAAAPGEHLTPAFSLGQLRGFAANEFAERGAATYRKLLCRLVAEHNSRGRLSYIAGARTGGR